MRRYASQTCLRVVLFFVLLLIVVGLGLVWYFYGRGAALFGLLCLFGTLIPVSLIAVFGFGLDALVRWFEKRD